MDRAETQIIFHPSNGLRNRKKHFPILKAQKGAYFSSAFSGLTPQASVDAIQNFYRTQRFASEGRDENILRSIYGCYERLCHFFGLEEIYSRNFVFTDSCSSAISSIAHGIRNKRDHPSRSNLYVFKRTQGSAILDLVSKLQSNHSDLSIERITSMHISVIERLRYGVETGAFEREFQDLQPVEIKKFRPNIVLGEAEYLANIASWILKCERENLELRLIPHRDFQYDAMAAKELIDGETIAVSLSLVSNFFGCKHDLAKITSHARSCGALINVDAAQALTQVKVDLLELDADFVCFSGHKALGPAGVGLFFVHPRAYDQLVPTMVGDAGSYVFKNTLRFRDDVTKFWSGVTATDKMLGFTRALEFVDSVGLENIRAYNKGLIEGFRHSIEKLDFLYVPSQSSSLYGLCTFLPRYGMSATELVKQFSAKGIAISALKTCEFPFISEAATLGSSHVARLSVHLYNTKAEIREATGLLRKINCEVRHTKRQSISFSTLPPSVKKVFCPWSGQYLGDETYNIICQKYALDKFDPQFIETDRFSKYVLGHFFSYSIGSIESFIRAKGKKLVIVGCTPNREPHYGTFLQIWAARNIAEASKSHFVLSLNDLEGAKIRGSSYEEAQKNTSRHFIPLMNRLGLPYQIALRSQDDRLLALIRVIRRQMTSNLMTKCYGRHLTEDEKFSIAVMVAELLRYQLKDHGAFDHIATSYGVEEMPHIALTNMIAERLQLKPIYALISRQIVGRSGHYKMSKSRDDENAHVSRANLAEEFRSSKDHILIRKAIIRTYR